MEINFNEIIILLIVFAPFFIVAIVSYYVVNTGFFQTELDREISNENIFYLDKIFGKYTDILLKIIL